MRAGKAVEMCEFCEYKSYEAVEPKKRCQNHKKKINNFACKNIKYVVRKHPAFTPADGHGEAKTESWSQTRPDEYVSMAGSGRLI